MATHEIPPQVSNLLTSPSSPRLALLTCGVSGSGKSTLARSIVSQHPNFVRFSIDASIRAAHGVHGVDYAPSMLAQYQEEAEEEIKRELGEVLRRGERDVVLDMAFYERKTREAYRGLIGREGGGRYRVVLVVFRGSEEAVWRRLEGRNGRGNGEGGGEGWGVSREVLGGYLEGFEWPVGEGEVLVKVE